MDTLTARDIVLATMDDVGASWENGVDYCIGYAEPGYGGSDTVVVFANWNDEKLAPLADVIEATDGAELEWSDEWARCEECYRGMRTAPDSYGWKLFGAWMDDYGHICADCLREDVAGSLEQYRNDCERAVTWCNAADMTAAGWQQWKPAEPITYETGWHPGQTDDPRRVLETIHDETDADVVFLIDGAGQFDVRWSAWIPADSVRGECTPDDDGYCTGGCVTRPHQWSASGARCTRTGCNVAGTGDRCNDGQCMGEES